MAVTRAELEHEVEEIMKIFAGIKVNLGKSLFNFKKVEFKADIDLYVKKLQELDNKIFSTYLFGTTTEKSTGAVQILRKNLEGELTTWRQVKSNVNKVKDLKGYTGFKNNVTELLIERNENKVKIILGLKTA
ncbi:MAG: hypothetical protein ABH824_03765 [Nanoarchaeota archaeon]|nr:hypothetical protein [Nanoarchaeota archaeon]MBU1631861.1 hypothetical protein [Nanoarchaeota archaeon]MBU1875854.1 hypothetical protein [Nanoarchaeota archaeon]